LITTKTTPSTIADHNCDQANDRTRGCATGRKIAAAATLLHRDHAEPHRIPVDDHVAVLQ